MISGRNAARLAAAGVEIPRNADGSVNAVIEIAPETACDAEDVAELVAATGLRKILPGQKVAL